MIGSIELYQNPSQNKYGYYISYFNEKGSTCIRFFEVKKHEFYMLKEAKPTDRNILPQLSWDGKKVAKIKPHPENIRHCNFGLLSYISELMMLKENRHILDVTNKPRIYACDIETAIDEKTKDFPDIDNPNQRIISFAFTDPNLSTYAVGDKPLSAEQIKSIETKINNHFSKDYANVDFKFKYKFFGDEIQMIEHVAKDVWSKLPLITGWHFLDFDWAYIYNRCRFLGVNPEIFSPVGRMNPKKQYVKNYNGEKIIGSYELPMHSQIHDYKNIFKKYDYTIKVKESMSLDWISNEVLGVKKIHYAGDLMELYHTDFEKYMFYNAVDTILVQLIHQKKQTLAAQISNMAALGIPLDDLYGTIKPTEKLLHDYFKANNLLIPKHSNKPFKPDEDEARRIKINYKGGLVLHPQPGRYYPRINSNIYAPVIWSKDFAGLYPAIMESFNFSSEGFVEAFFDMDMAKDDREKINGKPVKPEIVKANAEYNEKMFAIAREKAFAKYGNDPNYIISYRGAVYKNDKDYSLRTIQRELKESRDAHKALKFHYEGTLDKAKVALKKKRIEYV